MVQSIRKGSIGPHAHRKEDYMVQKTTGGCPHVGSQNEDKLRHTAQQLQCQQAKNK